MKVQGRFLVADKSLPSLSAAIGYAQTVALRLREEGVVYVRELGRDGVAAIIERDPNGIVHTRLAA
jgi:hypothetical protein